MILETLNIHAPVFEHGKIAQLRGRYWIIGYYAEINGKKYTSKQTVLESTIVAANFDLVATIAEDTAYDLTEQWKELNGIS